MIWFQSQSKCSNFISSFLRSLWHTWKSFKPRKNLLNQIWTQDCIVRDKKKLHYNLFTNAFSSFHACCSQDTHFSPCICCFGEKKNLADFFLLVVGDARRSSRKKLRKIMCWEKFFEIWILSIGRVSRLRCHVSWPSTSVARRKVHRNAIQDSSIIVHFLSAGQKSAESVESRFTQSMARSTIGALSSHRKKYNVKTNDNRKLMNSGNDVIAWNFFCLRRPTFNKQWNISSAQHCLARRKDPLDLHRTFCCAY